MGMFSKGRGLFGAPMGQTPGYGGDHGASPDAAPIQREATMPTYKKPSTANLIIGTIGDTLSQIGGGRGNYLPGLQRQQEYAREQALYQQRRTDSYTDWQRKEEYEAAHPKAPTPDNFTQTLRAAGIDPNSPEGRQLYRTRATTLAYPTPTYVSNGPGLGGNFVTPPLPGMAAPTPTAPIGKLTPLGAGGATPQGVRTFR